MASQLNRIIELLRDVPQEKRQRRLMAYLSEHPEEAQALRAEMGIAVARDDQDDPVRELARAIAAKKRRTH